MTKSKLIKTMNKKLHDAFNFKRKGLSEIIFILMAVIIVSITLLAAFQ